MPLLFVYTSFLLLVGSPTSLRQVYAQQDATKVEQAWKVLDQKSDRNAIEQCYYHVFTCLKAKYANNPYLKYKYFSDGYSGLNGMIAKDPGNIELLYHRYMIEDNAPSFLISTDHRSRDRARIVQNLKPHHPLYNLITKTMQI